MHALLLSDEPLTVAVGARRLADAGFSVEIEADPGRALRRVGSGVVALCVVDVDLEHGVPPALAVALTQAALATRTVLVAISALHEATHGWPLSAAKPFTAEQARAWRARTVQRLGISELTPVSVERLADNLGGCLEDAVEMLRDYESMAVPQHHSLRGAIAARDWDAVADIAHRVCGALGAIEAREAAATCRQLMNAAGAGDVATATLLAPRVVELLGAVELTLSRHTRRAEAAARHATVG